jgi:hypothetical protein
VWEATSNPSKTHWVVAHRHTGECAIFFSEKDYGEALAKEYAAFKNLQEPKKEEKE